MYSCYYCPILSLHRLGSDCSLVVSQVYSILKVTTIQAGTRNFSLNIIQLSLEGQVNSGGNIHRSSPTLRGIVVLVFTKSDGKKNASSISSSETFAKRCAIFLSVRKTVNIQGYSELREPIKTRENCYPLIW